MLFRSVERAFDCRLGETYGQTECGPVAINLLTPTTHPSSVGQAHGEVDMDVMGGGAYGLTVHPASGNRIYIQNASQSGTASSRYLYEFAPQLYEDGS